MAQVFISYKSEDRERLRPLVDALEARGIDVWWDPRVQGGSAWRETIEQQLEAARCVLVAWSERSVGPEGHFVRDEAAWAQERGTYLPLLLDAVRLPIGFGEVQALPLIGWKRDGSDPRLQAVLAAVAAKLGEPPPAAKPAGDHPPRLTRRAAVTGGTVIGVGAALGAAIWVAAGRRVNKGHDSIAVLPFTNLSGDPAQSYFSEGLAEELRDALTRIANLKVIGRASCEKVKELPANEVATRLGVASVLTGSVRRSPSILRVSTQLVDGTTGIQLWSHTYDRPPGDVLEIQQGIAERVAGALRIRLAAAEKASLALGGTNNAEAHDLVLRAEALREADPGENAIRQAIALCEAAIALDPQYFQARIARGTNLLDLADEYGNTVAQTQAGITEAAAEARRAIALAPTLGRGYALLGIILLEQLDISGGLAQLRQAEAISRDDPETIRGYARALAGIGRIDQAQQLTARALSVDPLYYRTFLLQTAVYFYARRFTESIAAARHTLALSPNLADVHTYLGDCLVLLGRLGEARLAYAEAPADEAFRLTGEAILAARSGDRQLADDRLQRMKKLYADTVSFQCAQIYAQLGDLDAVFSALDRAWAVKDSGLRDIVMDPWLDPARKDPRFEAIVAKLNLPA